MTTRSWPELNTQMTEPPRCPYFWAFCSVLMTIPYCFHYCIFVIYIVWNPELGCLPVCSFPRLLSLFRVFCGSMWTFYEKCHWNFDWHCVESVVWFGHYGRTSCSSLCEPGTFPVPPSLSLVHFSHLFASSVSFINVYDFQQTDLSPPWLNLSLGILFDAIVNGVVFLIFMVVGYWYMETKWILMCWCCSLQLYWNHFIVWIAFLVESLGFLRYKKWGHLQTILLCPFWFG